MDALAATNKINREQEKLIESHATLVKRIAYHLIGRLPRSVQLDDLLKAGMLGLLEAAKNYDAEKGAAFETYASIRIRGNMLDEVRIIRNAIAHRSVSTRQKFETLVRTKLGTLPPGLTVGGFLGTPSPGSTPPVSFLEFYVAKIDLAAQQIVPS